MNEATEKKLQKMAEGTENDLEDVKTLYEEKLEEVEDRTPDSMNDDEIQKIAVAQTSSDLTTEVSVQRSGEGIKILSVGYRGIMEDFGEDNDEVLISYGIVQPEDKPAGLGVFINEESAGVDLHDLMEKFKPLNSLRAEYSIEESNKLSDTYVLHATGETDVQVIESEMSTDEKRNWINENYVEDRATLAEIGDYISHGGADGWPTLFGGDIKRITGTIVDHFRSKDGTKGGYVIQDDSIVDPNDYGEEIVGDKRIPGLTCWIDPSLMDYGENSVCDFYGSISVMDDGQVVMNVFGIAPIMANDIEWDDDYEDSSSPSDNSDVEETTI